MTYIAPNFGSLKVSIGIRMRIGLQICSFTWEGGTPRIGAHLANIARAAEDNGFASIWMMDHLFQIRSVGQVDEPMLEGYSALNFIAGVTQRIALGVLVTAAVYRSPGMLLKMATTLDVLSGGRAYLGLGAAWNEREARGLGIPFPPLKERFERLEETLQIAHAMWSGETKPYEGKHYRLENPINSPLPLQRPHPPILVGGGGEKKTLRLVAQYADACNLFADYGLDAVRHKLEILRHYCDELGRPYDSIERTSILWVNADERGNLDIPDVLAQARALSDLGIQHLLLIVPHVERIEPLHVLGREVIPAVASW